MYVCMLLMAGQTAGPFGPKLSEVTAGTPGMVLGPPQKKTKKKTNKKTRYFDAGRRGGF
jgi:hypothetical protein